MYTLRSNKRTDKMRPTVKCNVSGNYWARDLRVVSVPTAKSKGLTGLYRLLCHTGINDHWPLTQTRLRTVEGIDFVFYKRKPKGDACKISFEREFYPGESKSYNPYNLGWQQVELHLDGAPTSYVGELEKLVRRLWEDGYNYIQCVLIEKEPSCDWT